MSGIGNISIFAGLKEDELQAIEALAQTRHMGRGSVVIQEGDSSSSLYLLLDGRVKVYVSDSEGKEFILDTLEPGDYFGELSLLDEEERSASVMATEKCSFSVIRRQDFVELLQTYPSIGHKLVVNLVQRIRILNESVKSLALKDVYGRIKDLLDRLCVNEENGCSVSDRLTQQDIANRVGSSREMVARILKDLVSGSYIKIEKKHIMILKKLPENY